MDGRTDSTDGMPKLIRTGLDQRLLCSLAAESFARVSASTGEGGEGSGASMELSRSQPGHSQPALPLQAASPGSLEGWEKRGPCFQGIYPLEPLAASAGWSGSRLSER